MDQVEIEITSLAITARYGSLAAGAILRTDAAYAKHLVEDAHCAKYTADTAADAMPAKTPAAPAAKATRGPKSKPDPEPESAADSGVGTESAQAAVDPAAEA